jgi:hypothetical protein
MLAAKRPPEDGFSTAATRQAETVLVEWSARGANSPRATAAAALEPLYLRAAGHGAAVKKKSAKWTCRRLVFITLLARTALLHDRLSAVRRLKRFVRRWKDRRYNMATAKPESGAKDAKDAERRGRERRGRGPRPKVPPRSPVFSRVARAVSGSCGRLGRSTTRCCALGPRTA